MKADGELQTCLVLQVDLECVFLFAVVLEPTGDCARIFECGPVVGRVSYGDTLVLTVHVFGSHHPNDYTAAIRAAVEGNFQFFDSHIQVFGFEASLGCSNLNRHLTACWGGAGPVAVQVPSYGGKN